MISLSTIFNKFLLLCKFFLCVIAGILLAKFCSPYTLFKAIIFTILLAIASNIIHFEFYLIYDNININYTPLVFHNHNNSAYRPIPFVKVGIVVICLIYFFIIY